jgi:hypothetical protein
MRGTFADGGFASQKSIKAQNHLIRCPVCGIWAPRSSSPEMASVPSTYCSRECFEKVAKKRANKRVG